ncbi:hypothetical protein [Polyangium aurulentum]|uniref:magnesium chelatase subunit ChlI family protein n=1 Tax=Polyangium aurulentum TaxID=2567896 RepID=UPI003B83040C
MPAGADPEVSRAAARGRVRPHGYEGVLVRRRGDRAASESSAEVRARVVKARVVQQKRFERLEVTEPINSRLSLADLERVAKPDKKGLRALEQAVERLGLSAELRAKVLRVARTIADLDGSDAIRTPHRVSSEHRSFPALARSARPYGAQPVRIVPACSSASSVRSLRSPASPPSTRPARAGVTRRGRWATGASGGGSELRVSVGGLRPVACAAGARGGAHRRACASRASTAAW